MFGITHFLAFALAAFLLIITPGNDTLLILSRSVTQGKKAGVISSLGIGTGSTIHTLLAAFGLSIIIAKSIVVFSLIKYIGAAYLVYLGCKMVFSKQDVTFSTLNKGSMPNINFSRLYKQAILTNVLNPKVAMFFIAFLPQFIDPTYEFTFLPFIILGLLFTVAGTIWCVVLAIFSSRLFVKVKKNNKLSVYLNRACGSILIILGIKLAFVNKDSA